MLSVSLLGDFCIRYGENLVTEIDTLRLQSLLAYLMLHRDAPQSRGYLSNIFWPDTTEAQARTNLRNLLHHLRHALPDADNYLDIRVQTLQWHSNAPSTLDVDEFRIALTLAEQVPQLGDPTSVETRLEKAAAIYKGDLLPSCYDDWIIPLREELRQTYLEVLERLIHILEEKRNYQGAIQYARFILKIDPLQEATYRHLIRLCALNGDRAGGLRVYHTCSTVLDRELGVEPSSETRKAYEQLLGAEAGRSQTELPMANFSPLVAREKDWEQILQAWRSVVTGGKVHFVLIKGEAGIGKTRLVEELLQWATRQGITSASSRCYAAEGELAYTPVITWLRSNPLVSLENVWLVEIARLLPEIFAQRPDLPKPTELTEAWQRQRLFEALSRAILGMTQPILLTIDDLQWCNRDTLEWLNFLLHFNQEEQLLVVGTYRPEEVTEDHPLVDLLQVQRAEGRLIELELQPLDAFATKTLATQIAGAEISNESAQHLFLETEGNPLFVVETVLAKVSIHNQKLISGYPVDLLPNYMNLPAKIWSTFEARLRQVSAPSRELAGLAATIGREFNFKLLAKASDCDEETLIRRLDELWQRRIVREQGIEAYDFSHDKLREVALYSMSAARRRLLHRQVAQALEVLNISELNPVSHQIAAHYEHAGLADQAIPYYLRAAKVARHLYANGEAKALLKHGLMLLEDLNPNERESIGDLAEQLLEELGDILELTASYDEALKIFQKAQTEVSQQDRICKARLHRKEGIVYREKRCYEEALNSCHQAEIALGKHPEEDFKDWWAEWIEVQVDQVWAYYWLARWQEIDKLMIKVRPIVQKRGNVTNRTRFLMANSLMDLRKYHYVVSDEMVKNACDALDLSRECGDFKTMMECQFEIGFLHLWRHEYDKADINLFTALHMAESSGAFFFQTLTLTYLTILFRFRNQMDDVLNYVNRAQKVAEVSYMPDYVAASKGNQAWLAWRMDDLSTAEKRAQEALELWLHSPLVYPFHWQALWPLIGVALRRDRQDEAWSHVRALLESTQQRLPERLSFPLEAAIVAKEKDQAMAAWSYLNQAMEIALEMGYL